jgi:hypothetical protein
MEVRKDDPRTAIARRWIEQWVYDDVVAYLESGYSSWTIEEIGMPGSAELSRTVVRGFGAGSVHVQPMIVFKTDSSEDPWPTCYTCREGVRHTCYECNQPMTHMSGYDCPNCWEKELKAIVERPAEFDPQ